MTTAQPQTPREAIRERKSNQQMPKSDDPIERRTGVELSRVGRGRRMSNRARLSEADRQARRMIVGRTDRDRRQARRIEDRLAARPRLHAVARQRRAVLAAIAFMLVYGGHAATAIGRSVLVGTITGVASDLAGGRRAAMRTKELELPIRTEADGARQAGKHRQGNHPPDDDGRQLGANTVHVHWS